MRPIDPDALPASIYRGPFHERQKAMGAAFYEDMDCLWTAHFGDPVQEYWAVRRNVGMWDVSSLVKFEFSGPDARLALDRLTTRSMAQAAPGTMRYCAVLDENGAMLDEATLCVIHPERAYLIGNDERPDFVAHLHRHTAGLRVEIVNVTRAMGNLAIQGPRALEVLAPLLDVDVRSLKWFQCLTQPVRLAGVQGWLMRSGFTGELGYEFFLGADEDGGRRVWDALRQARVAPIGLDAIEKLRIEFGLRSQGNDYFPGLTDPYDLSMDAYIDLDHAFIGRDACLRAASGPDKRFKTLVFAADDPLPAHLAPVLRDGVCIGDIRSAQHSPRFGTLALAVLRSADAVDGSLVDVGGRRATVRPVPLDPEKRPAADPLAWRAMPAPTPGTPRPDA